MSDDWDEREYRERPASPKEAEGMVWFGFVIGILTGVFIAISVLETLGAIS